jgi:DNA (cytosine-5)-methyltransferase 1
LGSLFDGIGGFPLAGKMAGIIPVWASEIEPFPIRVTEKRLPEMKHYGDVHGLNGADLKPVDIITFGSPCQDLSIAGKRSGLGGSRSGLFYEAVRVITEMRRSTNGKYPRWAVWENVPGALSSQNGQDFRLVLKSLVRIKDPAADVPLPESGRWLYSGEILGDGYSLAWRILDAAQGWGVAQRRKRIFAVLDLDGQCAGKVLFESEGVSGYTPPGGKARKGTAPSAESGARTAGEYVSAGGFCTEHSADSRGIGYEDERAPTLRAGVVPGVAIDFNPTDSRIRLKEDNLCQTLTARMGTGGNTVPLVFGISSDQSHAMLSENPHAGVYEADTSRTLDCSGGSPACNQGGMLVVAPAEKPCYCIQGSMIGRKEQNGPQGDGINREVAFTLDTVDRHAVYAMTTGSFTQLDKEKSPPLMARDYKDPPVVGRDEPTYALDRACFSAGENAQYSMNIGEEKAPTLVAEGPSAVAAPVEYLVRRLTPGECCRLQGYPDGWCENLESPSPSNKETDRWESIFEEWRAAMCGKTKPKTRRQIIHWLQNPHTDSAEYKAYGNSVAVPCVFFVLAGIMWAMETEVNQLEND